MKFNILKLFPLLFRGLRAWFKLGFMFFFILLVIVQAVILGFHDNDMGTTLKILGKEILSPIESAQDEAMIINSGQGSYISYINLFMALATIFFWIKALKWFFLTFIIMDDSRGTNAYVGAIFTYLIIQVAYLAFVSGDINIIWRAWVDIWHAIYGIFSNSAVKAFPEATNTPMATSNGCLDTICSY